MNAGEIVVGVRIDGMSQFQRNMRRLSNGVTQTTRAMSQKLTQMSQSMTQLGGELSAKLTAPIGLMGVAVLKMGGDFEQAMNKVRAVTNATAGEMEKLEAQARALGSTTAFSASQVADAMGFMGMAGLETNEILSGIKHVLDLAAAAQIDMASAADIVTNIMSSQGMTTEELAGAVDVLAKSFTSANTDLTQLSQAFKFAGPVSKTTGIAFEETASALALMGNAGIQSTMAGRSLRMALLRLVSPPKEAARALQELGADVTNADGSLKSLADILDEIEGASIPQLSKIFGTEALGGMLALMDQGTDTIRLFTTQLESAAGTAERIQSIQMEGFNGSLRRMKSAFEGLAIAIGESGVLKSAADFAERAANWFEALSKTNPEVLKMGAAIAGLAAVIGPVVIALGAVIWGIGQLAAGIGVVAAAMSGPIGLVALLGAAAAGFLLINRRSDEASISADHYAKTLARVHEINMELNQASRERQEELRAEKAALIEKADAEIAAAEAALRAQETRQSQRTEAQRRKGRGRSGTADAHKQLRDLQAARRQLRDLQAARRQLQFDIEQSEHEARADGAIRIRSRIQEINTQLQTTSGEQAIQLKREREALLERAKADREAEQARIGRLKSEQFALRSSQEMLQRDRFNAEKDLADRQNRLENKDFGGGHAGRSRRRKAVQSRDDAQARIDEINAEIEANQRKSEQIDRAIAKSEAVAQQLSNTISSPPQGKRSGRTTTTEPQGTSTLEEIEAEIAALRELASAAEESQEALDKMTLRQGFRDAALANDETLSSDTLDRLVDDAYEAQKALDDARDAHAKLARETERQQQESEYRAQRFEDYQKQADDYDKLIQAFRQGADEYEKETIRQRLLRSELGKTQQEIEELVEREFTQGQDMGQAQSNRRFIEQAVMDPFYRIQSLLRSGVKDLNSFVQAIGLSFRDTLFDAFITRPMDEFAKGLADGFMSAFSDVLGIETQLNNLGKKIGSFLGRIITRIFDGITGQGGILTELANGVGDAFLSVFRGMFGSFGGMFGGAFGGGSGLTPRAIGGPVLAGMPYLVGEKGPELFFPSGSGTIDPVSSMSAARSSGSNVTITNSFTVTGSVTDENLSRLSAEMNAKQEQLFRTLPGIIDSRVQDGMTRGRYR